MVQFNFDRSEVQETTQELQNFGGEALLPDGLYRAVLENSEQGQTNSGSQKITLTFRLQGNEKFDNKCLFHDLFLSEKAFPIAKKFIAQMTDAIGIQGISDTSELHNRFFAIRVGTEKGKVKPDGSGEKYPDRNRIYAVLPDQQGGMSAAGPTRPAQGRPTF